jgi:hypothetical protein
VYVCVCVCVSTVYERTRVAHACGASLEEGEAFRQAGRRMSEMGLCTCVCVCVSTVYERTRVAHAWEAVREEGRERRFGRRAGGCRRWGVPCHLQQVLLNRPFTTLSSSPLQQLCANLGACQSVPTTHEGSEAVQPVPQPPSQ